jgi:hypothetical protein
LEFWIGVRDSLKSSLPLTVHFCGLAYGKKYVADLASFIVVVKKSSMAVDRINSVLASHRRDDTSMILKSGDVRSTVHSLHLHVSVVEAVANFNDASARLWLGLQSLFVVCLLCGRFYRNDFMHGWVVNVFPIGTILSRSSWSGINICCCDLECWHPVHAGARH